VFQKGTFLHLACIRPQFLCYDLRLPPSLAEDNVKAGI
jgi:hypothetical protein